MFLDAPLDAPFGELAANGELIAATAEGPLDSDPTDARWAPISLTLDVPGGASVLILARVGAEAVITFVVYSDELDGIQPLFAGKTKIEVTGTVEAGRTFVITILPNGGWTRDSITIVPYIAIETPPNSNTTEGPLALAQEEARWTPITLTFDAVPVGVSLVIITRMGEGSSIVIAVYADELGGIQALFADKSVVEITGDIGIGRAMELALLPNGGWSRDNVELTTYFAVEATA